MNDTDQALDDMLNGVSESRPTFEDYAALVRQWASDRQILQNSTAHAQLDGKGKEELQEAIDALADGDRDQFVDGIGDTLVVLIIASAIEDLDITEALASAYSEIKDRRGVLTASGIFVKDDIHE